MKKTIVPFLIVIMLFACKKDETSVTIPKLKNCHVEYLYFRDGISIFSSGQLSNYVFPPRDSSFIGCSYFYTGDKLTRVGGGFIPISGGSSFANYLFSNDAYDSICYSDKAVYVYPKMKIDGVSYDDKYNRGVYYMDSNQRLIKAIATDSFHPDGIEFIYTYSPNLITETNNAGNIRRLFYFESNKLVKVLDERKDDQGVVTWKREILFQEYDNKPNPFKNMYFVRGAFCRAFSENNYKSYTINEYHQLSDGTLGLVSHSSFTMPILYNTDNYPLFGDYVK